MVTVTETETKPEVQTGGTGRDRKCPGCPRCKDSQAPLCGSYHPETPGVHPVCKWCGHCVLRGTHIDDAEDVRDGRFSNRPDPRGGIYVN